MAQTFAETPSRDTDSDTGYFTETQLSTLMRAGAWNLDSMSDCKCVNFVVLLENTPLAFVDSERRKSITCYYPKWGAAYIHSSEQDYSSMVEHLLRILDISNPLDPIEQDRYLLSVLHHNLQRISTAQTAFADLLVKSPFLEISSDLRSIIASWNVAARKTAAAMEFGDLATAAYHSAYTAKLAESAYYHPKLMGKMYFPSEHKMAVYLPLLLPTIAPVIFGCIKVAWSKIR